MFSLFRRKKASDPAPTAPDATEAPVPAAPPATGERVHTTFVLSDHADVPLDDLERQALAAGSQDDAADEVPEPADGATPTGGFMSRWFGGGAAPAPVAPPASVPAPPPATPAVAPAPTPAPATATNIEAARADLAPLIAEKDLELAPTSATAEAARVGWMDRLKTGLKRTGSSISTVFTGTQIDDALYEDLETALLMADAGAPATEFLLQDLKRRVKESRATDAAQVKGLLRDAVADMLAPLERPLVVGVYHPTVIMVSGVNGAGKTTSIGKLTKHLVDAGASVLLAAADTFRAAAREQLAVWADRNAVEIITQQGADPSAVAFDAVGAGRARRKDVVLVDTAGRLPTQKHLMEELTKIRRVVTKADITAPHEVLLVIDGNTGQNALGQVKAFDAAAPLTGLIVTKLDGTAKGGVLCAIAREKPVPVYFIGVGERLEDLQTFKAREFAEALVG
ncbi:signal recognition particle-docking protein FtsY [Ottowia sp.]|uniref:signal recognition particle-docking protein FtsY n=1 Tax=Ottowia sp. TaxID=1898956 RepID=UPI002B7D38FA|nr:signal recognition particle-docking protein FtsY [Ottowia sp.]HOB65524.1 signal recognition particle-docking protein FtsY [Ottowia sp.]HPZ58714.1 signal recognition particle-docking protein FtsY [Ottowia sp.]HQD48085.1 signal recognition particle-docking protein FtsY [Ottowia sp.]